MIKLIYSDYNEELLKSAGSLISLVENDSHIKQASSSGVTRDMLEANKPDKDHFMVHLIAIGDGEKFGANKNFDYFPKEANQKYHHTFVENGHFFREHKNRDPKLAIGHVKASAYNPEMSRVELVIHGHKEKAEEEYELIKAGKSLSFSMSCFPAGTEVTLANGDIKDIEDIVEGDEVITHQGNVGTVSATMCRFYSGVGVTLIAEDLPTLVCTYDHGIWYKDNLESDVERFVPAAGINPGGYVRSVSGDGTFKYHKVKEALHSDLVAPVYDLTVPGDHGFIANGYGVSNCRVPYDRCNCCGNKARQTADYCDCLKYRMGQYSDEFEKYAYAINDEPNHFDISRVRKPADRIAHYLAYEYELEKAASENRIITSAELAKIANITLPDTVGCYDPIKQKIATRLAEHETHLLHHVKSASVKDLSSDKDRFIKLAAKNAFDPSDQLTTEQINKLSELQPGTLFRQLAKRATVLPFRSFVSYVTGKSMEEVNDMPVIKYAEEKELPEINNEILETPCDCELEDMFDPSSEFEASSDLACDDEVQEIMDEAAEKFSIKEKPLKKRILRVTVIKTSMRPREKKAFEISDEDRAWAKKLALSYGFYKIACIKAMNQLIKDNFVDEAKELILVCQNAQD